jgi:hypothetical protein
MPTIDTKTIEEAAELVKGALLTYRTELDTAYLKSENALKVNLPVTFKPSQKQTGAWDIEVGINFVTSQIKDKFNRTYLPGQEELFNKEKDNVHYIKPPITTPEDWFSDLDWRVGWGKDKDRYEVLPPLSGNAEYAVLNNMRDDLEERMEVIISDIAWHKLLSDKLYRKEMYGIEGDIEQPVAETNDTVPREKKRITKKAVGQTWVDQA